MSPWATVQIVCRAIPAHPASLPVLSMTQMDAPQDPSAFIHRVGRTARAGRSGAALLYLSSHEASYVDFLKLRNVRQA